MNLDIIGFMSLSIGIIIGNVMFKIFNKNENWSTCIEHSYFQIMALVIAWIYWIFKTN